MSYDIYIEADLGGPEPWSICDYNPTYNLRDMFVHAFKSETGIRSLNGLTCAEAAPVLRSAIAHMEDDPDGHKAHNPPNGWGDYAGCLRLLREMLELCLRVPRAKFRTL